VLYLGKIGEQKEVGREKDDGVLPFRESLESAFDQALVIATTIGVIRELSKHTVCCESDLRVKFVGVEAVVSS
jgi:hypothetical protein